MFQCASASTRTSEEIKIGDDMKNKLKKRATHEPQLCEARTRRQCYFNGFHMLLVKCQATNKQAEKSACYPDIFLHKQGHL